MKITGQKDSRWVQVLLGAEKQIEIVYDFYEAEWYVGYIEDIIRDIYDDYLPYTDEEFDEFLEFYQTEGLDEDVRTKDVRSFLYDELTKIIN